MAKMDQGRMITAVGGVLLIVSLFLHWAGGQSAWDGFSVIHIIMLLIGIAAVGFAVLPATGSAVALPPSLPLVISALGMAAFGFAAGWELEISGDIGVWLAIIGSLAIAYGAFHAGRAPVAPATRRPRPETTAPPPAV
ncbi:MAG: hypothetical protein ACJ764_10335 [Solirubrobacteraceae bacterium]